ncbi:hypothetical protein IAG44_04380 [Streptomyces roseirectus]|uniref:Integral membrane protein n=1 Tax=Streptomyces roseirectus TaxID=2768066 RepID=A0A7H0I7K6_9ACTN|nr:DUF3592 domain-containing protein [Streptomyces roseirectus]QNP68772.1 hypothetical protein IAG44_04380 [Streptomyces roseirectus]
MGARTRTRVRGWRWRRNPLRRPSDVVENWTALALAVLLLVAAPLTGALAGVWAQREGRAVAERLRAERHQVRAEVVGRVPDTPAAASGREQSYRVAVRWSTPDGQFRTTTAPVPAGTRSGDRVDVWLDARGRGVRPPPSGAMVWQQTLSVAFCAAGATAGVVVVGYVVFRRTALRHRLAEWERDWARTEPLWTRRRA